MGTNPLGMTEPGRASTFLRAGCSQGRVSQGNEDRGKGDEGVDIARALERAAASALVIPAPELATLVITGGDRQTWLNGLITCDLAPLKAGEAAYGLFVAQKGRIVADAIVALEESRMLLALPRAVASEVRASLERHVIMEDVEIADGAFEVEAVHGPRAAEVLAAARVAGAHGGVLDRTGLGGALLFLPAQSLAPAREARDAALASVGGMLGDDQAWEALRLDRRVPQFGADFDATTYPQEAGLEKRADLVLEGVLPRAGGGLHAREARARAAQAGHAARGERSPPARGADVLDESGENVGTVTSAAIVPSAGGPVAMAMVKRATAEKGEKEERAELCRRRLEGAAHRGGGVATGLSELPIELEPPVRPVRLERAHLEHLERDLADAPVLAHLQVKARRRRS